MPIAEIPTDDADALEAKLEAATRAFRDRHGGPKPHERIAVLERLVPLLDAQRETFADLIAREGGKPLTDAKVEAPGRSTACAMHRTSCATSRAGRSRWDSRRPADRWAFTIREPIGVVAAISAFNHPLNLIVHQVVPAIAIGCPVLVKPASATPLCCHRVRQAGAAGGPLRAGGRP